MDVTHEAALRAVLRLANDAELELFHTKAKNGPLLHIVMQARNEAIDALAALAEADPSKVEEIRKLQNAVARFNDLVTWIVNLLKAGDEAWQEIHVDPVETERVRDILRSQLEEGDE